jgi:hypothetical protein
MQKMRPKDTAHTKTTILQTKSGMDKKTLTTEYSSFIVTMKKMDMVIQRPTLDMIQTTQSNFTLIMVMATSMLLA